MAVYLILLASIFGAEPGLPSLTWSHLRLNNKTDSKKNFCHLFGFKPFENDFVNLWVTSTIKQNHILTII